MKYAEILEKKGEDLTALEDKLRKELADLRLKIRVGQSMENARMGTIRKDIARVLTARKTKSGISK